MAKKPKTKQQGTKGTKPKATGSGSTDRLTRGQKVVVIIFIVIFALSTLAGALAAIVPSSSKTEDTQEETTTVASIDEQYEGFVADLEAKLAENAEDRATLLSLGKYCTTWASSVRDVATTDEETSHANELFDRAVGYYDQYLELEDSNAVHVSRALCLYEKGDVDAARTALEEFTATVADYGPAWMNLGKIYEEQGDTEAALAAYEKAVDADADDAYGAKSYAEERISALESDTDESATDDAATDETDATTTDATSDDAASTDGSDSGDLSDDLSDASGTGF